MIKKALNEIRKGLQLIHRNIPQLDEAYVWVHNEECVSNTETDVTCMELALSTKYLLDFVPNGVKTIHVKTTKGIVGSVLASESKSCFCPNLYECSIDHQPRYAMSWSWDACFAICLQSSLTGDLVYVMEFALYPGPATYEYIMSFLGFLLPVMKHELKTFKMACGKQLGEELVVEVIVSEAHKLGPTESNEAAAGMFPVKFKSVQYGLQKHQHVEEQQPKECSIVENQNGKRKTEIKCTQSEKRKGKQVSFPSVGAQDSKAMEKGKRKTGLPILNKEGTHPCIVEETEGDCKSET
ncbi:protein NLP7-like isoform X1 [Salvia splendens]|uniref:protein NLP7-like isoform X1 n=1 Tax=Salvia splendens TaxID=180675 RepID=UPI001C263C14|nr:protein NLP7-like isoform X1 [Salvia splendens]XP_042032762.1 protein NLP7-like isoform X1 [Salvia splendens]XP_042032763.1 protein NLP7-like isoform X1 [Salvia splendens]XP_042032764.1 protein NLP7-like isoform X1 [Salvia splendens]